MAGTGWRALVCLAQLGHGNSVFSRVHDVFQEVWFRGCGSGGMVLELCFMECGSGVVIQGDTQPSAQLVIIQMVSEAARIRYVEHLIQRNMLGENLNFIPDSRARSMENRWSDLSEQIEWSGVMRQAALALMLYRCNPKELTMPVPVAAVGADEQDGEPTTNIIGMAGKCVDVYENQYDNGTPIILFACGNAKGNQLWTFKSDGTIRSNGKCLTANGYASGDYIWIFDCDKAEPEATKWVLYNAGTIMNPRSDLVIAAESSIQRTVLNVAEDKNSSRQAWSASTQPAINYISGFREMCLQAN
nr:type 2 ribosome-inactivating protein precursor [Tanacetum cinerariifolium]